LTLDQPNTNIPKSRKAAPPESNPVLGKMVEKNRAQDEKVKARKKNKDDIEGDSNINVVADKIKVEGDIVGGNKIVMQSKERKTFNKEYHFYKYLVNREKPTGHMINGLQNKFIKNNSIRNDKPLVFVIRGDKSEKPSSLAERFFYFEFPTQLGKNPGYYAPNDLIYVNIEKGMARRGRNEKVNALLDDIKEGINGFSNKVYFEGQLKSNESIEEALCCHLNRQEEPIFLHLPLYPIDFSKESVDLIIDWLAFWKNLHQNGLNQIVIHFISIHDISDPVEGSGRQAFFSRLFPFLHKNRLSSSAKKEMNRILDELRGDRDILCVEGLEPFNFDHIQRWLGELKSKYKIHPAVCDSLENEIEKKFRDMKLDSQTIRMQEFEGLIFNELETEVD
jgi:inactive STAND